MAAHFPDVKSTGERWAEVVAFVLVAALLVVCLIMLPGCGSTSSLQSAQLPVVTPTGDPRHTLTGRTYVTYCGETCYSKTTEQIESGEADTWDPPLPTPNFPYRDPRTPPVPEVVCEPVP